MRRPSLMVRPRWTGPASGAYAEELHRTHAATVFRFLVATTRDADLAEDLMQDTFVRATRAMAGHRGGSPRACRVLAHRARRAFHAADLEEGGHVPRWPRPDQLDP